MSNKPSTSSPQNQQAGGHNFLVGISVPTQLVDAVLMEPTQTPEPLDHYGLLEEAYNNLLVINWRNEACLELMFEEYAECSVRLEQVSSELWECKSRMQEMRVEHANLAYVSRHYHSLHDH
jgi:hypothetical protein